MHFVEVEIYIEEPEHREALGIAGGDSKRKFECEFYHEPAERSVGLMRERFDLRRVTDTKTNEEFYRNDLPYLLWLELEEAMKEQIEQNKETARMEAQVSRMEFEKAYLINPHKY